uniref:Uncharacterized protein n=1 Tax=Solanum lycopersicum TaxID=4081 RepID=A0A3Q7EFG9_SOLLC
MLNEADDVISSTSSMCRTMGPSESRKSEEQVDIEKSEELVDPLKSQQEFSDTTDSSESESEASSDEDNDRPEDKDYRVHESSTSISSESDDIRSDFDDDNDGVKASEKDYDDMRSGSDDDYDGRKESEDDDLSCSTKQKSKEEGKKESNGRLVPQLAVANEKHRRRPYLLRPRSLSKSKKKMLNRGSCSRPVVLSDDEGSISSSSEEAAVRIIEDGSVLDIVHVKNRGNAAGSMPKEFADRTRGRYGRKYFGDSSLLLDAGGFRYYDSSAVDDSAIYVEGTVWDLVPMNAKATMYPHQREGFEFMWKNIAGDIILENLREPLSGSRGGCIISHPPGTGKTRLTIVFLQAFLKQFPKCRPVIIAPANLLLNWEAEFKKWEVDIPFHNLNNKDFSFEEDEATVSVFHCLSRAGKRDPQLIRMVKLRSWAKSKSVLGISYDLFRILTGEDGDGYAKEIREILLKLPGLLVLEEGHTARNDQSLMWQALSKVETEKRILLSGTPFQNNIKELYNTLSVVSPKFAADLELKWTSLSSCIDKNVHALEELRDMIAPLVHRCGENVKKESLPGIRDTVIHLKPTDLQKELLKRIPENPGSFYKQNAVSLISVHPSLVANRSEFSDLESQLKERGCRLDPNAGVKMKFAVELIRLCDGLNERVIIFSQLLDPLKLIKEQLNSLFNWTIGREILYMDGKLDVKQRQISINSLNDPKSDVKVLLASIKACSEGISLVGASRVVLLDVLWNPSVEQQAISRAYRNGQTRVVHVYCPVISKWEVDKIQQQTRKKYHSDVLLSRNEVNTCQVNPSYSLSDDNILEAMVQHENLCHIFEKLSHAPRVVPMTCFPAQ